jgi:ferredoxin
MAEEQRKQKGVAIDYSNQAISVHWEPSLCIHTGNCLLACPKCLIHRHGRG